MSKKGYINGSDMLLGIGGKNVGHSTSHTTTYTAETKTRSVKPVNTEVITKALYDEKSVIKLNISISAQGIRNYDETESGFKTLIGLWHAGEPVEVTCFERKATTTDTPAPYLKGDFIITKMTETNPAGDDATYDMDLELATAPEIWSPSALTGETITES